MGFGVWLLFALSISGVTPQNQFPGFDLHSLRGLSWTDVPQNAGIASPTGRRLSFQIKKIASEGVEDSSFSCEGRITGYYADVETGCRTYHYCNDNNQYSYACPNNTLFQQRIFICNHWYLVDCESSEQHYNANLLIGQKDKPFVEDEVGPPSGTVADLPTTVTEPPSTTQPTRATFRTTVSPRASPRQKVRFSFTTEDIQRVEEETVVPATTSPRPEVVSERLPDNDVNSALDGYIKLSFRDTRELFYIPTGNHSEAPKGVLEYLIPKAPLGAEVMHFKKGGSAGEGSDCPKYCDRRYVIPGTCHPCIMIK